MRNRFLLAMLLLLGATSTTFAQEIVNEDINTLVRKHGLDHSQAMEIAGWMTDVYGPRLTGSPMLDKATDWAQETLKEWGMENVHLESWPTASTMFSCCPNPTLISRPVIRTTRLLKPELASLLRPRTNFIERFGIVHPAVDDGVGDLFRVA